MTGAPRRPHDECRDHRMGDVCPGAGHDERRPCEDREHHRRVDREPHGDQGAAHRGRRRDDDDALGQRGPRRPRRCRRRRDRRRPHHPRDLLAGLPDAGHGLPRGARPRRDSCRGVRPAAACSGFVYALATASGFIRSGMYRNVLVIGVEVLSRFLDWTDRSTCVLFGDGAGAVLMQASEQPGGMSGSSCFRTARATKAIIVPAGGSACPTSPETVASGQHFVHMLGTDVYKYATRQLAESAISAVRNAGLLDGRHRPIHLPPGQPADHQERRR